MHSHGGGGHPSKGGSFPKNAGDIAHDTTTTQEECCGACLATKGCHATDFTLASEMRPTWDGQNTRGECHPKPANSPKVGTLALTAVVLPE